MRTMLDAIESDSGTSGWPELVHEAINRTDNHLILCDFNLSLVPGGPPSSACV